MKQIFFLIITIFIFSSCNKTIDNNEELDSILEDLVTKSDMAGFSSIIMENDKVTYQNSFGYADIAKKHKYDNDTKQPIASISKTVIGLALMKAIEQGYFKLETPINDILPFKVTNPNHKDSKILVKHLATHTSSLLDVEKTYYKNHFVLKGEDLANPLIEKIKSFGVQTDKEIIPLDQFLKNYYSIDGSDYSIENFDTKPVGSAYNYSNIASSLAAYLIEVKSGMSFKDYTKKYIFDPLGMTRTSWGMDANVGNIATLYWSKSEPLPRVDNASYPDGSLSTSNNDMAKYMVELKTAFDGKNSNKILTNESYKTFFEKQYKDNKLPLTYDSKENNAGIFWVYFTNGKMGHTGGDLGVMTIMAFDPKTNRSFYMATNSDIDFIEDNIKLVKQIEEILDKVKNYKTL